MVYIVNIEKVGLWSVLVLAHRMLEDMAENELVNASDEQVNFITDFLQNLLKQLDGFEEKI